MAISKKVKPKKPNKTIQVRKSDLKRFQREWTSEATSLAMVSFLTVMHDKEGYGGVRLARVWANVEKLMREVYEGRVDVYDLKKVLEEEVGVFVTDGREKT